MDGHGFDRRDHFGFGYLIADASETRVAAIHALAQALAGHNAEVLAATDALVAQPTATPHAGTFALRLLHARAMALRQTGRAAEAVSAAHLALAAAAGGDCPAIEHGLALAETARCHVAAGDPEQAERRWCEALAIWEAGQVDGPLPQSVRSEFEARQPS